MFRSRFLGLLAGFFVLSVAGCARSEGLNPVAARLAGKQCRLWDDEQGVAHVQGGNEIEALACLGYVHARDRAWQMDFLRRTAEGRRAEALGFAHVKSDFGMRLLGFGERAQAIFERMPEAQKELLWAYAHGVNRGFEEALRRGVYEFTELGYRPYAWHPSHTVALILLQGFDQTRRSYERDLEEQTWLGAFGREAAELFSPDLLPWDTAILKPGEYARGSAEARARRGTGGASAALARISHQISSRGGGAAGRLGTAGATKGDIPGAGCRTEGDAEDAQSEAPGRADRPPQQKSGEKCGLGQAVALFPEISPPEGKGSNNWVVAPARSRSGRAWLANDPHLGLKHPPFWKWAHVSGGPLDVIGAALPGVPVVVSGANRHAAWGLTNSYLDVADLAHVPLSDLASASESYRPLIWIRFGPVRVPFFFKSFRRTREGWPVLPIDAPEGRAVVLRWTGFELGPEDFGSLLEIAHAERAEELDRALAKIGVPSWNFVFADDRGSIGYRAIGKIPRREQPPLVGVQSSALAELTPWSYLTPEEMPHVLNPVRGFVATANNRQWPVDSALSGGRVYSKGFRAFRIEELLEKTPRHDLASLRKVQCDVQSVDSRFLLPGLLTLLAHSRLVGERERRMARILAAWDGEASLECVACAPYRRWMDRVKAALGMDEVALFRMLKRANEQGREVRSRLAQVAATELVAALNDVGVGEASRPLPVWGSLHRNRFVHLSGEPRFEVRPIGTPGDTHSVNPGSAAGWSNGAYDHDSGASHRLIVELTSPPTVYSALAGSEVDVERPDLTAGAGPWQRWNRCEQQRKVFPLDWSKVKAEGVAL